RPPDSRKPTAVCDRLPVGAGPAGRGSQPAQLADLPGATPHAAGLLLTVGRVDPVLDQVAGLCLDHGGVHGRTPFGGVVVWSDLGQDDVAADGPGLELDVVLPLLGGSDALDVGADLAGDGVEVGPDRSAGRDPDVDVAAGAL